MIVSDIKTKLISSDDDEVTYAIKADVTNDTVSEYDDEPDKVLMTMQGLDSDGFEVHWMHFQGFVPVGTTQSITSRETIKSNIFKEIVKWQVKGI